MNHMFVDKGEINKQYVIFGSRKQVWKCRLHNFVHFVSASTCKWSKVTWLYTILMDVILCGYVATWHSMSRWIGDIWYRGPRQIVLQQYSSMSRQRWDFYTKRTNDADVYMYTKCLVVTPVFIRRNLPIHHWRLAQRWPNVGTIVPTLAQPQSNLHRGWLIRLWRGLPIRVTHTTEPALHRAAGLCAAWWCAARMCVIRLGCLEGHPWCFN